MSDPVVARLEAALGDRYDMGRKLGEGGMATVYLAEDRRHGRAVAIKVLHPELAAMVGGERFLAEIRTTAALQHPHILPLHDSGEADGLLYYVMPFVQGESLRERLERERQLPVDEAVGIARKVASALQHAHEAGVIHRDVKPANILLAGGEPLVADFGIALAVSQAGGGRLTETGLSLGTPHYMSPEQVTGERTLDPRSDVYSLACMLYEMLTGEPPHGGATSQAVLARILTTEPQPASVLRPTVPAHVDAAVTRALEKLPADRFPSASAFGQALADPSFRYARAPARGAGRERSEQEDDTARPWPSRIAWIGAGAAATLLLVSLLTGELPFAGLAGGSSGDSAAGPTGRFIVDIGELEVSQSEIAVSPDGTLLAFAIRQGDPLRLRALDELDARPLAGTEGGRWPSFSPDGEWIAYAAGDGIRRIPVDGGSPLLIAGGIDELLGAPHWSEDGTLVFALPRGIYRVSAQGGTPQPVLEGSPFTLRFPSLLPGGGAVIFTEASGLESAAGMRVRILDLSSDSVRTVVEEASDARYVETGHLVYGGAGGTLFAVPFDLRGLDVTGPPVPVLEGIRILTGFGATAFAASPAGTAVYVAGSYDPGASRRLVLVNGADDREVLPLEPAPLYQPRFSPDGRKIAYMRDGEIRVYDLVLGTNVPIASEGFGVLPVWTRGGDSIVFAGVRAGSASYDLFVAQADGEGEPRLLLRDEADLYPASWHPSEPRLIFTRTPDGEDDDLMVLDLSGDSAVASPYLTADWDEWRARLSPDGRWVAYQSDEDGGNQVYVRSFPEPGPAVRISERSGASSRWSPDGDALYYFQGDTLMQARVAAEPSFRVISRDAVLVGEYDREYDVRPDGSGFIFSEAARTSSPDPSVAGVPQSRLVVVVNWFDELTRRMGGAGYPRR